ncbi:hypothetical protein K474DRAFT_1606364, partial [Panus rudis PR-1116 ss-1]
MVHIFVVDNVINALQNNSLAGVIFTLVSNSRYTSSPARATLLAEWSDLLEALTEDKSPISSSTTHFACNYHLRLLKTEICSLADKESGWHFSAENAREEQIEAFSIAKMAQQVRKQAPFTWDAIVISILLQSTNQHCNPFAAIMGLFLHSTAAPELVVEVLAHAGLSTSLTTIHKMVNSLSSNANVKLRELAKTCTAAFAYDNFDMDFKSYAPIIERPGITLQHATSALAFPLAHDVVPNDLKLSNELWESDPSNPQFQHLRHELGSPDTVMQIPVTKTTHIPCRAMDINSSTNDGQGQILQNLFCQANIGDPTDLPHVIDIREHVVLVHGDLGTGERLHGIKQSRSIERKEIRRLQSAIFVMGLFHLLMAAADAIWKMFIEPKELQQDPHGLFQHACRIRPHQTHNIKTKPGFRLMHDLIHQCGTARMLDIWETEIHKRNSSHTSLADFANSNPSWQDVVDLSLQIVRTYVDKPNEKDAVFRNSSLILARLLLYIELAHAMKHGDIGQVELTFMDWAFIFKTVSKHKYAAALVKTVNDLRYVYPPRLARAIRLNWLCNPTGKPDGFRAVDWLVELMNL